MVISSNRNPKIQFIRGLLSRHKDRREERSFVAEGVRLIEEAYLAKKIPKFLLYSSNLSERGRQVVSRIAAGGVDVEEIDLKVMESVSGTESSQGMLGVFAMDLLPMPENIDFILVVDGVRDPGNLGTILRTAEAASVQAVVLTPGTTDAYAPKVVRAGMGAHFRIPILTMQLEDIHKHCKSSPGTKVNIFLTDVRSGKNYWNTDFCGPTAIIIGGEAGGASPGAMKFSDEMITIPMTGGIESLNAAVAAGILLFEVVRQRLAQ